MKCPNCGYKNEDDGTFCISCGVDMKIYGRSTDRKEPSLESGAKIESKFLVCPNCGATNLTSERFCVKCDFKFTKLAPEPVAPPPQESASPPASHELRCPRCSGPMQPGIMLVPNGGLLSGVRWDTADGIDWWGAKGEVLVPSGVMQVSIRVPGFRCPACRVLVVTY